MAVWLTSPEERSQIVAALRWETTRWITRTTEWIEANLDQSEFTPQVLLDMAREHVLRGGRVKVKDDSEEEMTVFGACESRWYAVVLRCGDMDVFFKFKFAHGSFINVVVVSVHD